MKVNKYNLNFDLQDKNSDTFNFYDYIKYKIQSII